MPVLCSLYSCRMAQSGFVVVGKGPSVLAVLPRNEGSDLFL